VWAPFLRPLPFPFFLLFPKLRCTDSYASLFLLRRLSVKCPAPGHSHLATSPPPLPPEVRPRTWCHSVSQEQKIHDTTRPVTHTPPHPPYVTPFFFVRFSCRRWHPVGEFSTTSPQPAPDRSLFFLPCTLVLGVTLIRSPVPVPCPFRLAPGRTICSPCPFPRPLSFLDSLLPAQGRAAVPLISLRRYFFRACDPVGALFVTPFTFPNPFHTTPKK